jgi:hypothetical protein
LSIENFEPPEISFYRIASLKRTPKIFLGAIERVPLPHEKKHYSASHEYERKKHRGIYQEDARKEFATDARRVASISTSSSRSLDESASTSKNTHQLDRSRNAANT